MHNLMHASRILYSSWSRHIFLVCHDVSGYTSALLLHTCEIDASYHDVIRDVKAFQANLVPIHNLRNNRSIVCRTEGIGLLSGTALVSA